MITTPRTALERHGWTPQGSGYNHGGTGVFDGAVYTATLTRKPGQKTWRASILDPSTTKSIASTCSRCPERALTAMVLAGIATKETNP